jgi:PKD repeat protein
MKKILFFFLWVFAMSTAQAQSPCSFTKSQAGNTVTASYMWILPLIYSLDSVYVDFGDGTLVKQYMPVPTSATHTYTAPGTYNLCLTRYLSMIGSTTAIVCTYCDSVFIPSSSSCFVNAGFTSSASGLNVGFNNTTTCSICTTISHSWNFGDGSPLSTALSPSHTYSAAGTYNVCLISTGTNPNGVSCSDTTCTTVTVSSSSGQPCIANAAFSSSVVGMNASFTNTSTCISCNSTTYAWNFGDGSPISTAFAPTHTYAASGVYNVCLKVTGVDTAGNTCIDSVCNTLAITAIPGCNLTALFNNTNAGLTVNFTNATSCTGCSSWTSNWNFGDGSPNSTLTSPNHTYTAAGNYNVCLYVNGIASGGLTCSDTLCKNVVVILSGINDIQESHLEVYPNPVNDQLQIKMPQNAQPISLEVIDMTGRKVIQIQPIIDQSSQAVLNMSTLNAGWYWIRLQTDRGIFGTRVLRSQE